MTDFEKTKKIFESFKINIIYEFNKNIIYSNNNIYTTFLFDDNGKFINFYNSL